ncbi:MAG: hypothetical protein A3F09_04615 [Chlamydiae bacterium RIFCSPHIGHO2_12_FULL_49_11]|nr:MAG: hypothetical protein A3F09_04615 [Chlamydiae bacterium RIFCSPHIGHO2_12_FULL_49_11]
MAEEKAPGKKKAPTALKRQKQDAKKSLNNRMKKSKLHTQRVKFEKETTRDGLGTLFSILDKAAKSGVIKPNKASRLKSRLAKRVK